MTHVSELSAAAQPGGGELRLPRPPGAIRRFWAEHPRVTDTVIALVVFGFAVMEPLRLAPDAPGRSFASIALILVSVTGVFLRRSRPVLGASALIGGALLAALFTPSDIALVPAIFAVYSLPVYGSVRSGWIAATIVEVASALTVAAALAMPGATTESINPVGMADLPLWPSVVSFAIRFAPILALAVAVGINVGNRRRYLGALIDRAHQLARERDQQAQLATAAERARIAREMHDIVSHSLTMMIALAEGSATAARADSPEAASAMRKVADTGRAAMVDMRRMLGVIGGVADTAPQPGFAELPDLIDRFRALGIPVRFSSDAAVPADPTVQLAVFRVVQEALTNTVRYARDATAVDVEIRADGATLAVTVTDTGQAVAAAPAGTGHGLMGLCERLAALGGTLTAGRRAGGTGWQVYATLPVIHGSEEGA